MTGHYFDAYQRLKKSEIIVSNLFIIPIHPIEPAVLYMAGYYRTRGYSFRCGDSFIFVYYAH